MTVVVGMVAADGSAILAADPSSSGHGLMHGTQDTKAFSCRIGGTDALVGVCGSWRWGQVLRYRVAWPDGGSGEDPDRYMAVEVSDAIRKAAADAGYVQKADDQESTVGTNALIARRGGLYQITGNFEVVRVTGGYHAIGAGAELAIGALAALAALRPPEDLAQARLAVAVAVRAVRRHSPWCCQEPVQVRTLVGSKEAV